MSVEATAIGPRPTVLDIADVSVSYAGTRGYLGRRQLPVDVVKGVSLSAASGETVGLVGESGSGKTTLGRAVLRLLGTSGGSINVAGFDVGSFGREPPKAFRKAVQVVFQDPVASLNPTMTVGQLVGEPLQLHLGLSGAARSGRTAELLGRVGLPAEAAARRPFEFSGGQRQRIAIARALASEPQLIVLDEPVSALDVSTQSQVINLLEELQADGRTTYLFIAHDLAVVRHISHRIAVMYQGRIVETGPADEVCDEPAHPYTQLLLASTLIPNVAVQRRRKEQRRALARRRADVATIATDTIGCVFASRCPHAEPRCRTEHPPLGRLTASREVACHLAPIRKEDAS